MKIKNRLICLGIVIAIFVLLFNYSPAMLALRRLPDTVYVRCGESSTLFELPEALEVSSGADIAIMNGSDESLKTITSAKNADDYTVTVKLFGIIPVKTVNVKTREKIMLMPGGCSVGVAVHTDGILVVDTGNITTPNGEIKSPAAASGIRSGDILLKANGLALKNAEQLMEIANSSKGDVKLSIRNDQGERIISVKGVYYGGEYKLGMWVRDSTAGIGTLSFYDPATMRYGALGHAITDIDTNTTFSVSEGELAQCKIIGVSKGESGSPGELKGVFTSASKRLGDIADNTDFGIYGSLYSQIENPLYPDGVQLAYPGEVKEGSATILTTTDGDNICEYKCNVIKLYPQTAKASKGLIIKVTDEKLLETTGGIIQGMSGSPVIQDGKLIAIITHVFINDPSKGYCMYALWMYQSLR